MFCDWLYSNTTDAGRSYDKNNMWNEVDPNYIPIFILYKFSHKVSTYSEDVPPDRLCDFGCRRSRLLLPNKSVFLNKLVE